MQRPIDYLSDDAVYRRTPAGQRELLDTAAGLSRTERRFLGIVTGFTSLRVLLDMDREHPGIGGAVLGLVERGLIRLEPSPERGLHGPAAAPRQRA